MRDLRAQKQDNMSGAHSLGRNVAVGRDEPTPLDGLECEPYQRDGWSSRSVSTTAELVLARSNYWVVGGGGPGSRLLSWLWVCGILYHFPNDF